MGFVKELIKENKIAEAITFLLNEIEENNQQSNWHNELLQLSARLNNLNSNKRKGILSNSEETLELNKIRNSLIEIVSNISTTKLEKESVSELLQIIKNCRIEIIEINSSITALKEQISERTIDENKRINSILEKPNSKVNFEKIQKILKSSSIEMRIISSRKILMNLVQT